MELTSILKIFTALSGMTDEEALAQVPLVKLCIGEVRSAVRAGVSESEHREPLEYAAGALAFYRHTMISAQSGGITSVKSGETEFNADAKSAVEAATILRDEFMAIAAPYLCRSDFYFHAISSSD